jgi:hypothetical protein
VITLQNPHGLPPESPLTGAATVAIAAKTEEKAKALIPKAVAEAKKTVPCRFPYFLRLHILIISQGISLHIPAVHLVRR